jgi:hypothetical protein
MARRYHRHHCRTLCVRNSNTNSHSIDADANTNSHSVDAHANTNTHPTNADTHPTNTDPYPTNAYTYTYTYTYTDTDTDTDTHSHSYPNTISDSGRAGRQPLDSDASADRR